MWSVNSVFAVRSMSRSFTSMRVKDGAAASMTERSCRYNLGAEIRKVCKLLCVGHDGGADKRVLESHRLSMHKPVVVQLVKLCGSMAHTFSVMAQQWSKWSSLRQAFKATQAADTLFLSSMGV